MGLAWRLHFELTDLSSGFIGHVTYLQKNIYLFFLVATPAAHKKVKFCESQVTFIFGIVSSGLVYNYRPRQARYSY